MLLVLDILKEVLAGVYYFLYNIYGNMFICLYFSTDLRVNFFPFVINSTVRVKRRKINNLNSVSKINGINVTPTVIF